MGSDADGESEREEKKVLYTEKVYNVDRIRCRAGWMDYVKDAQTFSAPTRINRNHFACTNIDVNKDNESRVFFFFLHLSLSLSLKSINFIFTFLIRELHFYSDRSFP